MATLLNVSAVSEGRFRYAGYVFRTYDDDDQTWKDSVREIAECAALIVVDVRTESPSVEFESRWMAEEFAHKTVFVMGDNGEMPALTNVTTSLPWMTHVPALTVASLVSEIMAVGVAGLPHLHQDLYRPLARGQTIDHSRPQLVRDRQLAGSRIAGGFLAIDHGPLLAARVSFRGCQWQFQVGDA